jgi:hypothetical protein
MPKPQTQDRIETTWSHKGVTIHFNPSRANFWADAPGKKLSAGSLDAIKAKVDKLSVDTFTRFEAYVPYHGYNKPPRELVAHEFENFEHTRGSRKSFLLKVTVASLDKSEGGMVFRTEEPPDQVGARDGFDHVYPFTDQARELWVAKCQARFDEEKVKFEADQADKAATQKFENLKIVARDWKPGQGGR